MFCPETEQGPVPALTDRIVRPEGMVSVSVIGLLEGPLLVNASTNTPSVPAVIVAGSTCWMMPTSLPWTRFAATLTNSLGVRFWIGNELPIGGLEDPLPTNPVPTMSEPVSGPSSNR
jgi:hypothetical protein